MAPALLANLLITTVLVGLIWTVQVVHYPLFRRVGPDGWAAYHAEHGRRIAWLVAPLMSAEVVAAAWLLVAPPDGLPPWLSLAAALPVVLVWAVTAGVAVPLHARLERQFDTRAIAWLVRINWVRTLAWTARGVLLVLAVA